MQLFLQVEQKVVACFDALESEEQDNYRPAVAEARVAVPNLSDLQSHCYVKKPETFYGNGLSGEGTTYGLADAEEHFKLVLLAGVVKRSNYKHAGTVAADITDVPALEQSGTRAEGLGLNRNMQLPGALVAFMPVSLKGQCTPARRLLSMHEQMLMSASAAKGLKGSQDFSDLHMLKLKRPTAKRRLCMVCFDDQG